MKLDHFFILTEPHAPAAELLNDMGLVEGTPNDHPGQGTSNRRFFFSNSALELVYVRDAREANAGPGRSLQFPRRAANRGASPFGLILKGSPGPEAAPFAGWTYQPDYFPPEWNFLVGENSTLLAEPLCIYIPFDPPPQSHQPVSGEPYTSVTELRVGVPVATPSPVLTTVSKSSGIVLRTNTEHLLEVVFNDEREGLVRDLRPDLPLKIYW